MKTIIAILFVLAICIAAFGFYRGWFVLSSPSPADGGNEVNVNLATDPDKIKEDAETVKDKAAELTGDDKEPTNKEPTKETEDDPPTDTDEVPSNQDTNR